MQRDLSLRIVALAFSGICWTSCGHQLASKNVGAATGQMNGKLVPPSGTGQEDGQWLIAAKDYASTRFSGLDEITNRNVGSLKVAWTFSTGLPAGHEGAPLVAGSTMYVVTPFPN